MTIGEAREHIGHGVVYRPREHRPWAGPSEQGVITGVGHVWVFVRYGTPGSTAQATSPADLELLRTEDGDG
jgi:hypothetical protein